MAGGQERILRRRIKSVQATKKITKAMELIAASRIVRAQSRIAANRPYREGMARIVAEAVAADAAATRKIFPEDAADAVGILVIAGDRGLSGAYNGSVLRATDRLAAQTRRGGAGVTLFAVGRKAPGYFRFRQIPVERSFIGFIDRPVYANAQEVAATISAPFLAGEIGKLYIVSTRFISAGRQIVEVRQILPFADPHAANPSESPTPGAGTSASAETAHEQSDNRLRGYTEFEPDPDELLRQLIPRAVESEVYSALLEASAAFFTAQQRAMAAATENADDLITSLSRTMNRARQDAITTEIMEIVSGAEALRESKGAGRS
jgi:F-type H+-transporting ATPase subunit gamma